MRLSGISFSTLGIVAVLALGLGQQSCTVNSSPVAGTEITLSVDTIPTLTALKLELTKQYCLENYGVASYMLDSPQIVLVHFTVVPTLEETVELFKKDSIDSKRANISQFSQLNVGIHYIVDKDGSIYKLVPDSVIARHVIGFNHVSIGIENIAKDASELTPAQLESNAKLIALLKQRNPGIAYVVGHHEYNNRSLPHFKLYKAVNQAYEMYDKPDPGEAFMRDLRKTLQEEHSLTFLE